MAILVIVLILVPCKFSTPAGFSLHSPTHVLLVRCQDGGVLIWSDGRMQMIHIVASYWDFKLYIQCAFLYSMIQHSVAHYGRSLTRSVQFPPEKISFKYFCKPSASNELDTASLIARWGYLILGRAVQREVDITTNYKWTQGGRRWQQEKKATFSSNVSMLNICWNTWRCALLLRC